MAEAQPASESAEQTASAILPQAPCEDTQPSDNSRLFTATHEQLLQLVCNLFSCDKQMVRWNKVGPGELRCPVLDNAVHEAVQIACCVSDAALPADWVCSFQLSRHFCGRVDSDAAEKRGVSSVSVEQSLQQLADLLQAKYPKAAVLTQKALQIGIPQEVRCCTCPAPAICIQYIQPSQVSSTSILCMLVLILLAYSVVHA